MSLSNLEILQFDCISHNLAEWVTLLPKITTFKFFFNYSSNVGQFKDLFYDIVKMPILKNLVICESDIDCWRRLYYLHNY